MEKPTLEQITELQKQHGLDDLQGKINSGLAWSGEGSFGRAAALALEDGACMLPEVPRKDYYGKTIPARGMLKAGAKGTFENSQDFWQGVIDGEIDL